MDVGFSTRLSRRGFLRGSALGGVGLATAAVIGCDDDDDDDDDAATTGGGGGSTGSSASGGSSSSAEPAKTAHLNDGRSGQPPSLERGLSATLRVYELDPVVRSEFASSGWPSCPELLLDVSPSVGPRSGAGGGLGRQVTDSRSRQRG